MDANTFEHIVLARRTCKEFDGKPVPKNQIEQLLKWGVRAPNHRLNEPWRFRVVEQPAIVKLATALRKQLSKEDIAPLEKALSKLSKVGALLFVGTMKSENPIIAEENYAATCAAIQNILLGAATLGIETYWSTNRAMNHPETLRFLEWTDEEKFVGAIWLGYGTKPPLTDRRDPKLLTRWFS